jgi:hypothetical protein
MFAYRSPCCCRGKPHCEACREGRHGECSGMGQDAVLAAVDLARLFHEEYERLAPNFGYSTREASAVPWDDVPETNRNLMVATAAAVIETLWRAGLVR